MADIKLSEGTLERILREELVSEAIIQVMAYKELQTGVPGDKKFRLLVNDGKHTYQNVLVVNPEIFNIIKMGRLEKFAIIKASNFNISTINDKQVMLIGDIEVVKTAQEVGRKIGNPIVIDANMANQINQAPNRPLYSAHSLANPSQAPPMPQRQKQSNGGTEQPFGHVDKNDVLPLSQLTPYTNKWIVRARVTSKREKKTWSNARGEGTLFSFEILDNSGTEMRITAFKNECDKFYDMIQAGSTYYIANGQVKPSGPYGPKDREYEITLGFDSKIQLVTEDSSDIPMAHYKFTQIADLERFEENTYHDLCAVIKDVNEVETIVSKKSGQELKKKDMTIVDASAAITYTAWGQEAENFPGLAGDVICVKGARVSSYGGRCASGGDFKINPVIPETEEMKTWWLRGGQSMDARTLTTGQAKSKAVQRFICELTVENLAESASMVKQPSNWMTGTIIINNRNPVYKSCKTPQCNKKLDDMGNGFYKCTKCNKEMSDYDYRFMMGLNVLDPTGDLWITLFDDLAQKLVGKTANELVTHLYGSHASMSGDVERLNEYLSQHVLFKTLSFRMSSKLEVYKDEQKLKHTVWEYKPIDYKSYSQLLLKQIDHMSISR